MEYSFKIIKLNTTDFDNVKNAVWSVDFEYIGKENGQSVKLFDSRGLGDVDENSFIAYDSLTENNILDMLKAEITETDLYSMQEQLKNKLIKNSDFKELPWV
mgnify:CR=1 FL=1